MASVIFPLCIAIIARILLSSVANRTTHVLFIIVLVAGMHEKTKLCLDVQ